RQPAAIPCRPAAVLDALAARQDQFHPPLAGRQALQLRHDVPPWGPCTLAIWPRGQVTPTRMTPAPCPPTSGTFTFPQAPPSAIDYLWKPPPGQPEFPPLKGPPLSTATLSEPPLTCAAAAPRWLRPRLALLLFLLYAVPGSWLPLFSLHLQN